MSAGSTNPSAAGTTAMSSNRGHLFIIAAPSGAGKTTLCRAVLERFGDIVYSISSTTRSPRAGERHGVDYNFITKADFKQRITEGQWAEWAEVHGNYYGTDAEILDKDLARGRDILLDIDVQGTLQIIDKYADAVTIFIMPPSLETLKTRLKLRGSDSEKVIARRLANAEKEMAQKHHFRHLVINDRLSTAVAELLSIIHKYRNG